MSWDFGDNCLKLLEPFDWSLSESVSKPLNIAVEKPRRWHVVADWSPLENRAPHYRFPNSVHYSYFEWLVLEAPPYLYLSGNKLELPHISEHTGCVSSCVRQASRIPSLFCSVPCVRGSWASGTSWSRCFQEATRWICPLLTPLFSKHPANAF